MKQVKKVNMHTAESSRSVAIRRRTLYLLCLFCVFMLFQHGAVAQEKVSMVRLAKLVIDPAQLEEYKSALREEIETSLRVEPGVLTLFAVSEKDNPAHITILEIYADTNAYKAHLQTPHFLKYKNGTINMVKSLELVETNSLFPESKLSQTFGERRMP